MPRVTDRRRALGAALVIAAQNNTAEDLLRQAAVTADDPGDPPAGTWLAPARPRPKSRAVRVSASGARRLASETKAVLHETVKSSKKVGLPLIDSPA